MARQASRPPRESAEIANRRSHTRISWQIDAAEDLYRELAESGTMGRIALAKFIGEHRDMTAGLGMLQEIYDKGDPKVAPLLVKYGADLLRLRGYRSQRHPKARSVQTDRRVAQSIPRSKPRAVATK